MSADNGPPSLFPHGGQFPFKAERVSTEQTQHEDFHQKASHPEFHELSLGRSRRVQDEGTLTWKKTRWKE